MEISSFNKFLSHEMFLMKLFNNKKLLPGSLTYFKTNDFTNILEYYFERALLKAMSKCKEENL